MSIKFTKLNLRTIHGFIFGTINQLPVLGGLCYDPITKNVECYYDPNRTDLETVICNDHHFGKLNDVNENKIIDITSLELDPNEEYAVGMQGSYPVVMEDKIVVMKGINIEELNVELDRIDNLEEE